MFYLISTLSLVLITLGLLYRRKRRIHIPLMLTAFVLDLSTVLMIEVQRHVIEDLIQEPTGLLTYFHICISTIMLILYGIQIGMGIGLVRHNDHVRLAHRYVGIAFVVFRLTNYVTSFMIGQ